MGRGVCNLDQMLSMELEFLVVQKIGAGVGMDLRLFVLNESIRGQSRIYRGTDLYRLPTLLGSSYRSA